MWIAWGQLMGYYLGRKYLDAQFKITKGTVVSLVLDYTVVPVHAFILIFSMIKESETCGRVG